MTRIWMNHWFSTAYNVIRMLKQDNPDFYIIGTNENPRAVYSTLCDEWYTEPVLPEDAYLAFCLDFCRTHAVDVFVPRRGMLTISRAKADFAAIGVKVLVDDAALIYPLNCKSQAYQMLADCETLHIPDYQTVENAADFKAAYETLHEKYDRICFKFERDEGGRSFRLIDNTRKGYAAITRWPSSRISFADAFDALSEVESFPPMIVMPYLPNEEISADCLQTPSGLIMIPRIKGATRTERVVYDADILDMIRAFHARVPLQMPFNIQFKYLEGIPYFLEVNTRMSGGVQLGCAAAGVNLPSIAVNQLLGIEKPWTIQQKETFVTHVETPIVFS